MNRIKIAALIAGAWVLACAPAAAGSFSNYKVIYSFCAEAACADGAAPFAPLAVGHKGVLYGTTTKGGTADAGTVFMLEPDKQGDWHYSVLHSFCTADCADGKHPHGGLILDTDGNLYGTTTDRGVAFRLNPDTQQFDILHAVGDSYAALSFKGDKFNGHSALYGTAAHGGRFKKGAVFVLRPNDDGTWSKAILWSFCAHRHCPDGAHPYGGVAISQYGLIGVTSSGGDPVGGGVVFQLHGRQMMRVRAFCNLPCGSASPRYVTPLLDPLTSPETFWIPTREVLIEYSSGDGGWTNWGTFDPGHKALSGAAEAGDVFGTTSLGGNTSIDPEGGGIVWAFFKFTHGLNDIHRFCQQAACADGSRPAAAMVLDPATFRTFYGTTTQGGTHGEGVVYQLVPTTQP